MAESKVISRLIESLSHLPGVGPKRQRLLVEQFGSLEDIRRATSEEIAAETGIPFEVAQAIKARLD